MTRAEFINTHRRTKTVLVYRFPDMLKVTATSKHVIADNTITIGKRAFCLDGFTVAIAT